MTFSKTGSVAETSVLSVWKSGWTDLGARGSRKMIQRIKVFYTGTSGTLNVNFEDEEHDVGQDFDIDLSVNPQTNSVSYGEDNYKGDNTNKIYIFYPDLNSPTVGAPIGNYFQFTISDSGITSWTVEKIEVLFTQQPLTD